MTSFTHTFDEFLSATFDCEENMLLGYYWGYIDKFNQVSSHFQFSLIFILRLWFQKNIDDVV
jgi:hypothetical protein